MINSLTTLLSNQLKNNTDDIKSGARSLLEAVITCLKDASAKNIINDSGVLIPKQAVINIMETKDGKQSDENIRKRVQQLNDFFKEIGFQAKLKSRKTAYLLEIDEGLIQLGEEQRLIDHSLLSASKTTAEDFQPPEAIPALVLPEFQIFISHKWHDDEAKEIFTKFATQLSELLSVLPPRWADKFKLKLIFDSCPTEGFKPHKTLLKQQDKACEESALGLILWSSRYISSDDCQRELAYFIDNDGENCSPKSSIVVLERGHLGDMSKVYTSRLTQSHDSASLVKFWDDSKIGDKDDFLLDIREKICISINENFDDLVKQALYCGSKFQKKSLHDKLDIPKRTMAATQVLINEKEAEKPEAFHQDKQNENRIDIIEELTEWAYSNKSKTKRVTALLGDFGFGKTISCNLLAHKLGKEYNKKEDSEKRILPIYLDLKALLVNFKNNLDQPVEYLLETMINKTGDDKIEGKQVIDYIRNHPTLVIFDGFDEIGQKLDKAQQQNIYHKLLDVIPNTIYQQDLKRLEQAHKNPEDPQTDLIDNNFPSRILISCRTHFFNRMESEISFLNGNQRHAIGEQIKQVNNIQRYYMAPFKKEAIEHFINNVLGEEEGKKALGVIQEVHDLSGLSSHPIMLKMITQHLPSLLALREHKRTINASTLYLRLFDEIGERDTEKHIIRLADKQQLLAALALDLWRNKTTTLSIKKLDNWFTEYGNQHPVLKNQFSSSTGAIASMLQDLCNASLLVRDANNHYRFSHTSYFEFFQALGVFETIRKSTKEDSFDIINKGSSNSLSNETLRFLSDWRATVEAEEREEFDQKFKALLTRDSKAPAKKIGFDLWQRGQQNSDDFPHSNKPDWSGLEFTEIFIPKSLSHLDLSQANLQDCYFHLVHFTTLKLSNACFDNARLYQCYFKACQLHNTRWEQSQLKNCRFGKGNQLPQNKPDELLAQSNRLMERSDLIKTAQLHPLIDSSNFLDIAWHPEGAQFISASFDGTVKLWNSANGKVLLDCVHLQQGSISYKPKPQGEPEVIAISGDAWKYLSATTVDKNETDVVGAKKLIFHSPTVWPEWEALYKE